jgi:hypothetical protein
MDFASTSSLNVLDKGALGTDDLALDCKSWVAVRCKGNIDFVHQQSRWCSRGPLHHNLQLSARLVDLVLRVSGYIQVQGTLIRIGCIRRGSFRLHEDSSHHDLGSSILKDLVKCVLTLHDVANLWTAAIDVYFSREDRLALVTSSACSSRWYPAHMYLGWLASSE